MKIIRAILFLILTITGIFCAILLFCIVRPDVAKAIAERYNKTPRHTVSAPALSAGTAAGISDDNAQNEADLPGYEGILTGLPSSYDIDDSIPLEIPDEMKGLSGYEEVSSNETGVTDPEAHDLEETLTYGNTGDDLEFDSLMYPYYHMLDDTNKAVYRQIYANASDLNAVFAPCEKITSKRLRSAFTAVCCDHPGLFWLNTAYSCLSRPDGSVVSIELSFNETADNLAVSKKLFDENAEEILAPARELSDDYEKETYIHGQLINRIDYNLKAPMNQSAYSALVNDLTVCAGYSRAFQYLCQSLGIPAYYCAGNAGEPHAWNIIKLEDDYYNVDTTWDDTAGHEYDYYNKSDTDYAPTHRRRELSVYLPPCRGDKYTGLEANSTLPSEEEPASEPDNRDMESEDTDESEGDHQILSAYEDTLKDLSDYGKSEDDIVYDMASYYDLAKKGLKEGGIGSYEFDIVISGRELVSKIRESNATGAYKEAYMQDALISMGAKSCVLNMEIEELKGGNFIIKHSVETK